MLSPRKAIHPAEEGASPAGIPLPLCGWSFSQTMMGKLRPFGCAQGRPSADNLELRAGCAPAGREPALLQSGVLRAEGSSIRRGGVGELACGAAVADGESDADRQAGRKLGGDGEAGDLRRREVSDPERAIGGIDGNLKG